MANRKCRVDAELVKAFEVVRKKLQLVLKQYAAAQVEIKQLKIELEVAHQDIASTIVTIQYPQKAES